MSERSRGHASCVHTHQPGSEYASYTWYVESNNTLLGWGVQPFQLNSCIRPACANQACTRPLKKKGDAFFLLKTRNSFIVPRKDRVPNTASKQPGHMSQIAQKSRVILSMENRGIFRGGRLHPPIPPLGKQLANQRTPGPAAAPIESTGGAQKNRFYYLCKQGRLTRGTSIHHGST